MTTPFVNYSNTNLAEESVLLEGLRLVGAGLATIGLTGAGMGIASSLVHF